MFLDSDGFEIEFSGFDNSETVVATDGTVILDVVNELPESIHSSIELSAANEAATKIESSTNSSEAASSNANADLKPPAMKQWNKFSGSLLRTPVNPALVKKRRNPFTTAAETPHDGKHKMAEERHEMQMKILHVDHAAKEIELAAKKIELDISRAKLQQQAEEHRVRMKILKSQLSCAMKGQSASEPSGESTSDDDEIPSSQK